MTAQLYDNDAYKKICTSVVTEIVGNLIYFDQTIFYPAGGGQLGDTGYFTTRSGRFDVLDTLRSENKQIAHSVAESGSLSVGDEVELHINWDRRYKLMKMHTCLHLLCSIVPAGVTGGGISENKGRLDFDLSGTDINLDKVEITQKLNNLISNGYVVTKSYMDEDELLSNSDLVRTIAVAPPLGQGRVRLINIEGVDLQPCGGTHVNNTKEIGAVKVRKIENKGRANKRINVIFEEV